MQVPAGALVKQPREGVRKSRSQRKGRGAGGGRAAPEKQGERESGAGDTARMRAGISAGGTEKLLAPFGRFTLIAFPPFLFLRIL